MIRLFSLFFLLFLSLQPAWAQQWTVPTVVAPLSKGPPDTPDDWATQQTQWLVLHGEARDDRTLSALARGGEDALKKLSSKLDIPIGGTIHVVLAPTEDAFSSLQPGHPPGWADGTAYPSEGFIFLKSPRIRPAGSKPLQQVFTHELTHILFGRRFYPQRPPRWLQEGVAQVYAGEHSPEIVYRLSRGGPLISLDELHHGFPIDPQRADLAYAQSADFVSWIQAEHGEDAIKRLIHELETGQTLDRALRITTGLYVDQLDEAWRDRLNAGGTLWLVQFGKPDIWWSLISAAAAVALLLAYRRRQKKMRRYAEAEIARDALTAQMIRRDTRLSNQNATPSVFSSTPSSSLR